MLGVCFWLIYQVKHSHDKKKEFDEKDAKLSEKTQSGGELKFGRKDLHPRLEGVTKNEKHEEEEGEETGGEEEENKHDEEEREEENKHELKPEEEENKGEETEDEERGGGDDEIDENDQEKPDGEADHDEDFIDEEKEREEDDDKESEEKQSQVENENPSEDHDHDHDGDDQNTHEAREEHYKGDDASSAVTHDTQTIISESEKLSSENSIEQSDMNILEQENKLNNTQETDSHERTSAIKVGEGEMAKNDTSLIEISVEHKDNDSSTNTMNSSVTNSTMTTQTNVHPEGSNNTTLVSIDASNTSAVVNTEGRDIKEGISGSSQQNGTVTLSDSGHAQNLMVNGTNAGNSMSVQTLETEQTSNSSTVAESNQSDVNSTISINNNSEPAVPEKITTEAEDGSLSSESKENIDATKDKKSDSNSESDGNDESSENSSRDETLDEVQHDPIDISDSHIGLDEKEVRIDLDTLPEIRTEGDNSEDISAE